MARMVTYIAGMNHRPGSATYLRALPNGQPLELKREPKNPHDKNAVAVFHGRTHLGYVPATDAPAIAKVMDSGLTATAVLSRGTASSEIAISWDSEPSLAEELDAQERAHASMMRARMAAHQKQGSEPPVGDHLAALNLGLDDECH